MTFLLQQTVIYTVPLILVALAGVFAERSGIINLALEGIMIIGARLSISSPHSKIRPSPLSQKSRGILASQQGSSLRSRPSPLSQKSKGIPASQRGNRLRIL